MKALQIFTLFFISLIIFSCTSTKVIKPNEKRTVWVDSTMEHVGIYAPGGGGAYIYICPKVSDDEQLTYSMEMPGIVSTEFQPFCGIIEGFDFREGYFQKISMEKIEDKISEHDFKTDVSDWKLIEVLDQKKDPTVGEVEKLSYWIGPEIVEVKCFHPLAPKDCTEKRYQYQEGSFYRGGAWKPLYMDISIEDYEEGYIYQVTFTKRYNSEMMQVMDGDNFTIEDFQVVSKEKL